MATTSAPSAFPTTSINPEAALKDAAAAYVSNLHHDKGCGLLFFTKHHCTQIHFESGLKNKIRNGTKANMFRIRHGHSWSSIRHQACYHID